MQINHRDSKRVDARPLKSSTTPRYNNVDRKVVEGFGNEWHRFDQSVLPLSDAINLFKDYFRIFPWDNLPEGAVGFDLGCGSGRWARFIAPMVTKLHCIDASEAAIKVAKRNLSEFNNCEFHCTTVDNIPLKDNSLDFGYSLGVLHHIPDTLSGLCSCVKKLRPGAPFLLYLYYAFDNRPAWFRFIWKLSETGRCALSQSPFYLKSMICDLIAAMAYWPLARIAKFTEKMGASVDGIPLSAYRNRSFYVMRTDALDRFGTRLEKRFTKLQIQNMMEEAGLQDIRFNEGHPCWVAVGTKK